MTMTARKTPAAKKAAKRTPAGNSREVAAARKVLFAERYIANGGNGKQAAIDAGYSPKSAPQQSCELLKDPKVSEFLEARRAELASKYQITTENVIKSLAQAVHFDPRKLYTPEGSLKPINELDDDTAMALSGFEVTEEKGSGDERGQVIGYTKKVKWLDKNTAREQAMKHLGLFAQDNKQKNPLDGLSHEALKAVVQHLGGKVATVGRG